MTSLKCLAIGDPHIKVSEIEYTDIMLREVLRVAREIKPDFIVVLGDTLHTNNKVDTNPLCRAVEFLGALSEIAFLVVLIGNHDLRNNQVYVSENESPEHPFTALKRWPGTLVCDRAQVFEVKGEKFCGVPYVPTGRYFEAIAEIETSGVRAFFSHQQFRGVKNSPSDKEGVDGDIWPEDTVPNFSGHYHEAQIVHPHLIYVGTPAQQNYGESPDKGVALITFSDDSKFEYERIPLPEVPTRKEYKLQVSETQRIVETISEIRQENQAPKVQLSKVKLFGKSSELVAALRSPLIKELKACPHIKVCPEPDTSIQTLHSEEETQPSVFSTFLQILEERISLNSELRKVYEEIFSTPLPSLPEAPSQANQVLFSIVP